MTNGEDDSEWLIIQATDVYGTPHGINPVRVHSRKHCQNRELPCVVHSPSAHKMSGWPLRWCSDTQVMERMCPHDIGHPDPDHIAYVQSSQEFYTSYSTGADHECDGCCK